MSSSPSDTPLLATDVPPRTKPSNYPSPFAERVAGRTKRQLGDHFGLRSFGVNHTTLAPGAMSALMHRHTVQDEFVYVIEGHPTLHTPDGSQQLAPGMCVGFPAGGVAHHLVNRTDHPVVYLEIGDRQPGDAASYPQDDLVAEHTGTGWRFTHKDGTPY